MYDLHTHMHRYRKENDAYSTSWRTLRRTDSPRSSLSNPSVSMRADIKVIGSITSSWHLFFLRNGIRLPRHERIWKYRALLTYFRTSQIRTRSPSFSRFLSHTISSIVCILICSRYTRSPTYSSTALPQIILTRIPTPSLARKPHPVSGHVQRCPSKDFREYDVVNEAWALLNRKEVRSSIRSSPWSYEASYIRNFEKRRPTECLSFSSLTSANTSELHLKTTSIHEYPEAVFGKSNFSNSWRERCPINDFVFMLIRLTSTRIFTIFISSFRSLTWSRRNLKSR